MTQTMIAPTEKQLSFYNKLVAERQGVEAVDEVVSHLDSALLNRKEISGLIDWLLKQPKTPVPQGEAAKPVGAVEDGMYKNPDTGEIMKVQVAVHGSGALYAKRLVLLSPDRYYEKTVRGKVVVIKAEFVFESGLVRKIDPAWKMTLQEAMEYGQLYGVCCNCGATLTDDSPGGSQELGIGPICARRFA